MLTANIDVSDGLVNGVTSYVTSIFHDSMDRVKVYAYCLMILGLEENKKKHHHHHKMETPPALSYVHIKRSIIYSMWIFLLAVHYSTILQLWTSQSCIHQGFNPCQCTTTISYPIMNSQMLSSYTCLRLAWLQTTWEISVSNFHWNQAQGRGNGVAMYIKEKYFCKAHSSTAGKCSCFFLFHLLFYEPPAVTSTEFSDIADQLSKEMKKICNWLQNNSRWFQPWPC